MKNKFKIEEVQKIARLSALELREDELENFSNQFTEILGYFELLDEVEISDADVEKFEKNTNNSRKDEVFNSRVSPNDFSSYLSDGFFKIPRVIDQER